MSDFMQFALRSFANVLDIGGVAVATATRVGKDMRGAEACTELSDRME